MCVLFLYTLLKVVSYYYMSVMCFQKSWVGRVSSIRFYFGYFEFLLTKPLCHFTISSVAYLEAIHLKHVSLESLHFSLTLRVVFKCWCI